jgi:2-oxoglutarate dehydrogenase complex dehydrogenase (E1) component-like enzyme
MQGHNAAYLEQLYAQYSKDPNAVDEGWRQFFESLGDAPEWMRRPRRRARPGRAPTGRRNPPMTDERA